jgi:hypothetical protein
MPERFDQCRDLVESVVPLVGDQHLQPVFRLDHRALRGV